MDLDWDENNEPRILFERVQHRLGPPLHWGSGANCPCCSPNPLSAALLVIVYFSVLAEIPSGPLAFVTSGKTKAGRLLHYTKSPLCILEVSVNCDIRMEPAGGEKRSAFPMSVCTVASPWLRVGIEHWLLLRCFMAFQNFFRFLGFSLLKYAVLGYWKIRNNGRAEYWNNGIT